MQIELVLTPLITLFAVQSLKLATDGIKGNFSAKDFFITYGGMPSTHSAIVSSFTSIIAYKEGLFSPAFSIAMVFSLIVIVDAMSFRRHIDQQGRAIKKLIGGLPQDEQKKFPYFSTRVEHTLPQVAVGILLGFTIASIIALIT
ncbi:MAG: divergent PAP2 family protein [Patescibacteria group bacterium]|jgi:hypothetical protein